MNSQRVHVYTSTTPIDYERRFQYMVDMLQKLLLSCRYTELKPEFKLRDKWEFKVEDTPR